MKLIYVAHPYQGKKENEEKADKIIKELYKKYPEHSFVSPIHGIRCGYEDVTISDGLSYCLTLLSKCDEIILCKGWENSVGCTAEAALANSLGIKTSLIEDWIGPRGIEASILEMLRNGVATGHDINEIKSIANARGISMELILAND